MYILGTLDEFRFGSGLLAKVNETQPNASAPHRFALNALYSYASSFFLASGNNLARAVTALGHGDLLTRSNKVLDGPLGQATLRKVLTIYRNQFLSHPRYSYKFVERALKTDFDLSRATNAHKFARRNSSFFNTIIDLHRRLAGRFPEVYQQTSSE